MNAVRGAARLSFGSPFPNSASPARERAVV